MVTPIDSVIHIVLAAVRNSQCFQVHTIFDLQIINDLIIGIIVAISLHRHRICRQDNAVAGVSVGNRHPACVLRPLISAPDPHMIPRCCLGSIHFQNTCVKSIQNTYRCFGDPLQHNRIFQSRYIPLTVCQSIALLLDARFSEYYCGCGGLSVEIHSICVVLLPFAALIARLQPHLIHQGSQLDRNRTSARRILEPRNCLTGILKEGDLDHSRSIGIH